MESKKNIFVNLKVGDFKKILGRLWDDMGMVIIFLAMFAVFSIFVPFFFTRVNMIGVALSVTTIGLVAATMIFVLAGGGVDLSVGSTVAFSGVVAAILTTNTGNVYIGILGGIAAGGLVGLVNAGTIAYLKLTPLIATLATMQIVRGLAFIVSGGRAVIIGEEAFFALGIGNVFGIANPIWFTIGGFVVFGILLNNTAYGRNTLATGGNEEAARLAGINVARTKATAYAIQGLVAGLAGVILASRMASGQPNAALGFELDVIGACVLGGVSLFGGVASITAAIIGVLIIGTAQNAMHLMGMPVFFQFVMRGVILLLALYIDRLKQRRH